jgi:hypothetical protein
MADEWFVRVHGKVYGPVAIDVLREWQREGRLIPENEVQRAGDHRWISASDFGALVGGAEPSPPTRPSVPTPATWRSIFGETFRIYFAGLPRFIGFALLAAIPMFFLQMTLPKLPLPDLTAPAAGVTLPSLPSISIIAFVVLLLAWPVSASGLQLVADDILHRRTRPFREQLEVALRLWGRMAAATLLVYGSYFFWAFAPFAAMTAIVSGGSISVLGLMLFLLIGAFMVYMNARLFINFLFWQQAVALGEKNGVEAIRESKQLARSVPEAPRLDRPLYRGAIMASLWLLLVLGLGAAVQVPFLVVKFMKVATADEALLLAQSLAQQKTPDRVMLLADIMTALVHLLLRPLLAAVFVVLYYDAKTRSGVSRAD